MRLLGVTLSYLWIAGRALAKTCWLLWISALIGMFGFAAFGFLAPVINEPCKGPPPNPHEIDMTGLIDMAAATFDRLIGQEPRQWPEVDESLPECERDPFGLEIAGLGGIMVGLVAFAWMAIHTGRPSSSYWREQFSPVSTETPPRDS